VLVQGGLLVILLGAWIGGKSIPEKLARWLFRFTLQGEEFSEQVWERMKAPFVRAGFIVETRPVVIKNSTLFFLLARKPKFVVK